MSIRRYGPTRAAGLAFTATSNSKPLPLCMGSSTRSELRSAVIWLEEQPHGAGLERRAVGEPQPDEVGGVVEQSSAGARHDGRERQDEHVKQPVGQQIPCEAPAAVGQKPLALAETGDVGVADGSWCGPIRRRSRA